MGLPAMTSAGFIKRFFNRYIHLISEAGFVSRSGGQDHASSQLAVTNGALGKEPFYVRSRSTSGWSRPNRVRIYWCLRCRLTLAVVGLQGNI